MPDEVKVKKTKTLLKKEKKEIKKEAQQETKKEQKNIEKAEGKKEIIDPFSTLRFVLMSEKAIQIIESQNKLVFVVDRKAKKGDIRKAVESEFNTQVDSVQTMSDQKARKKAYVKFKKPGEAGEIAIKLGII